MICFVFRWHASKRPVQAHRPQESVDVTTRPWLCIGVMFIPCRLCFRVLRLLCVFVTPNFPHLCLLAPPHPLSGPAHLFLCLCVQQTSVSSRMMCLLSRTLSLQILNSTIRQPARAASEKIAYSHTVACFHRLSIAASPVIIPDRPLPTFSRSATCDASYVLDVPAAFVGASPMLIGAVSFAFFAPSSAASFFGRKHTNLRLQLLVLCSAPQVGFLPRSQRRHLPREDRAWFSCRWRA